KQILDTLQLPTNSYYYQIERIREVDETPYIYQKSYLPEQYINPNYPEMDYYSSIYRRLKLDYGIDLSEEYFVETNEILFPTPNSISERLEMDKSEPVVFQKRLSTLSDSNKPIEYVESYKKWDFFKI
ncbi:TPA: UTRA domain-containing protein, partial [Enterococcus faecalis]